MARDNKIQKLSPMARAVLDKAIVDAGYGHYGEIAQSLGKRLGVQHLSRSLIAGYGRRLRDQAQRARIELELLGDPAAPPARLHRWARANTQEAERLLETIGQAKAPAEERR